MHKPMNDITLVAEMAQLLDNQIAHVEQDKLYLTGKQQMAFMSTTAREATKITRMASNIPQVQVNAIAERLRVTAVTIAGNPTKIQADWVRNDLDQRLPIAFREALGVGSSFAIVWDSTGKNRPLVSIESAEQVVVKRDPVTREIVAALKRVSIDGKQTAAWLYLPDRIVEFRANVPGASLGWSQVRSIINPLGVVPVVEFSNSDTLLGGGRSEVEDMKPLVDALNKLLGDLMVGSEFYARPRRWATGVEMGSDDDGNPVNPFPEGDRMLINEAVEGRFGSLPAADLSSYESAVKVILGQIMAVSALPAHYLGALTGQAPGADGLRAAEAALTSRAESKQRAFGRSVEMVARLMWAIKSEVPVEEVEARVRWSDAATRSIAQEADAVVKLHEAGLLPADYALARLGYDTDEIEAIRAARVIEQASKVTL